MKFLLLKQTMTSICNVSLAEYHSVHYQYSVYCKRLEKIRKKLTVSHKFPGGLMLTIFFKILYKSYVRLKVLAMALVSINYLSASFFVSSISKRKTSEL